MRTIVIKGVRRPSFDVHIERFAEGQTAFPHRTNIHRVAVLNDDGVLYRVIEFDSVSAAIALLDELAPHNVWDRITVCEQMLDVVDRLNRRPYRGHYDGIFQSGIKAHPLPQ